MVIHPDKKCQEQVTKICTDNSDESADRNSPSFLPRADAPPPAKGITEIVKRRVAK